MSMRKSIFCLVLCVCGITVFASHEFRLGVKVEAGAHAVFVRDFEGFFSDENALFLYVTAMQPEIYEKAISSLRLSVDSEKLTRIAENLKAVGVSYVILPAKNYDGFCFFDSDVCDYNIKDYTETKSDWLSAVSQACRNVGLRVGFSYSVIDWHHPSQIQYRKDGRRFPVKMNTVINDGMKDEYLDYMTTQLKELTVDYKADLIWFDGGWAPWWTRDDAESVLRQLKEINPNLKIGGRVRIDRLPALEDVDLYTHFPSDFKLRKRDRPWIYLMKTFTGVDQITNEILYRDGKTLIKTAADVWSRGGGFLIGLDVTAEAFVSPSSLKILKTAGQWLKINREAVFDADVVAPKRHFSKEILFVKEDTIYCLQMRRSFPSNGNQSLRLPVPKQLMTTAVKEAFLLTKEGRIPITVVSDKKGRLLRLEVPPKYREEYENLFLPIYGFVTGEKRDNDQRNLL